MTVKVPTTKFKVSCMDCHENVELEFLPDGTLHSVDDRDYYQTDNSLKSPAFTTNCGHEYYWDYTCQEPMYMLMVARFNWEPNDTIFGYLMPGPDGHVKEVVTL